MKLTLPLIHCITMAPPLIGKSTWYATWVEWFMKYQKKPTLILGFDKPTKFDPYLALGNRIQRSVGDQNQPITRVLQGDTVICQIEHFVDENPRKPNAYSNYMARWPTIAVDVNAKQQYACVILDSTSFLEVASTWHNQYLKYPLPDNERKYGWNSYVTRDLREVLHGQLTSLNCHVGVAVHEHMTQEPGADGMVTMPHVPGQLRAQFAGAYNAMVRMYWEKGQPVLQTKPRDGYACGTSIMIDAPDPCAPDFNSFIANIVAKQRASQAEDAKGTN